MREELGMSKQMGNPQESKYGYNAGFAGLEYNEEKANYSASERQQLAAC